MSSCGIWPMNCVGPPCSGNGDCVFSSQFNRSICSCHDGYQGISDFQVGNNLIDCQINIIVIRVLWAIFLALNLMIHVNIFRSERILWRRHCKLVDLHARSGRKYRLWDNKSFAAALPFVIFGMTSQHIYAITKLVNEDLKLGESILLTNLFLIFRTTFFFTPDSESHDDEHHIHNYLKEY